LSLTSSVYFDKKNIHGLPPLLRKLNDEKILRRLQSITQVENLDCLEVIQKYDSATTFFYVDPPYYEKEHYYTQAFGRDKHRELAECLGQIQGKFALSYYEFPELLTWFPEHQYKHNRYSISKQNSSRTNKQRGLELVITN
jgi:DNA adenine methylase